MNINPFQDMRAVILCFYNKRLSESRAIEQNQENQMGAGWTAYDIVLLRCRTCYDIVCCDVVRA